MIVNVSLLVSNVCSHYVRFVILGCLVCSTILFYLQSLLQERYACEAKALLKLFPYNIVDDIYMQETEDWGCGD